MVRNKDLFIAIDGNALVHRAFHAYPPTLITSDGLQVNAVYGFTVMLLQMFKQFDPKYVLCAFDTSAPTFRHLQYSDYKGHRKPVDKSLSAQFPIVEEVLRAFNIPILKKEGFEADDILGTLSEWKKDGKWSGYDFDMYLLTGDRDFLQLISDSVSVCMPIGSFSNLQIVDRNKAFEKYGYYPEQVLDYKAVVGDASDNIPGIKGIGEKTVIDLLQKYNTLEGIYNNLNSVSPRYVKLFREGLEQAEFSRQLATIKKDVDLQLDLNMCLLSDYFVENVEALFKKLEFRSLISKLPKSSNMREGGDQLGMFGEVVASEKVTDIRDIDMSDLKLVINVFVSKEESYDGSEFSLQVLVDNKGGLSTNLVDGFMKYGNCETWSCGFEDSVSQNVPSFDIKLLAFMLSSGKKSYTISSLAFDLTAKSLPEKISKQDIQRVGQILVEIVEELKKKMSETKFNSYVTEWFKFLREKFKDFGITDYELVSKHIDLPLARVLRGMEDRGVLIDEKRLRSLKQDLDGEISHISKTIFDEIGHEFNLNSPKQLSDVIFSELGLPAMDGGRSTREEILVQLTSMHPSIEYILKYREVSKVLNTYVEPLLALSSNSGIIEVHTDFKQTGASSGRFSSVNPNMQNLPARGEWAAKIRSVFIPREGFVFVGADYSQIEFRIMADISEDLALIEDFNAKKDIHRATAARILGKSEEDITTSERNIGKTINFAILFGQTPFGLSKLANIPRDLAKKYIDDYFKTFSGVAKYIENSKNVATKYGYVQSMFGRTRYVSGLSSRNRNVYQAAVREAVNMPIQGGEADIMRLSMVEIDSLIKEKYTPGVYMILQIHDELIFEVRKDLVAEFSSSLQDIMCNVVTLKVPLSVNVSSGLDMSELK